jgi:hypothetical protein
MGHWRVDIETRNDLVAGRRKGLVLGREAGGQCSRPKEKQFCDSITSSSLRCMNFPNIQGRRKLSHPFPCVR